METVGKWIPEMYQLDFLDKLFTENKNRFIIFHDHKAGVTTAMAHFIAGRMGAKDNYRVLIAEGNGSDLTTLFKDIIKELDIKTVACTENSIQLENGSTLWHNEPLCIRTGMKFDLIYCEGKPIDKIWSADNKYEDFLNEHGMFVATGSSIGTKDSTLDSYEYWGMDELKSWIFEKNKTTQIFVPWWMPSWNNKDGVELKKHGRANVTAFNCESIERYYLDGYEFCDHKGNCPMISHMWRFTEGRRRFKHMIDEEFEKEKVRKEEYAMSQYDLWKEKYGFKKPCLDMGLESLREELSKLKNERLHFVDLESQAHNSEVSMIFYDKAIKELDNDIKEYEDEIALAEALEKDKDTYKALDIDGFVNSKKFEPSKILSSKDMMDVMTNIKNEDFGESVVKCVIKALRKLGYSNGEIDENMGDNAIYARMKNKLAGLCAILEELKPIADKVILSPELEKMIDEEVITLIKDKDFMEELKHDDLDEVTKSTELKEDDANEPIQSDDFDTMTEDDLECNGDPLVDIVDWGGINTSVSTCTSKKNFEAYLVIDGVDYTPYVDSVTADYMEREVMVEIVDDDNNAIPKLVNYWEGLYNCDEEPLEDDIIVRTNSGNKSFETFKDCAIVDFICSSYVNEDFPRRATLVFSFGKATTEYCAE